MSIFIYMSVFVCHLWEKLPNKPDHSLKQNQLKCKIICNIIVLLTGLYLNSRGDMKQLNGN